MPAAAADGGEGCADAIVFAARPPTLIPAIAAAAAAALFGGTGSDSSEQPLQMHRTLAPGGPASWPRLREHRDTEQSPHVPRHGATELQVHDLGAFEDVVCDVTTDTGTLELLVPVSTFMKSSLVAMVPVSTFMKSSPLTPEHWNSWCLSRPS